MESKEPRISLCMIVRDESRNLSRCLDSIKGLVDEIIVIDTGSTDGTPQLAGQYGCVVKQFPWTGDFSAARNYSLDQASGDWVIYLDADEELQAEGINHLSQVVKGLTEKIEGLFLPLHNLVGLETGDYQRHMVLRLFKNNPAYRFQGSIHEQVTVGDSSRISLAPPGLKIVHYGYLKETRGSKNRRNLAIIRRALDRDPANPYLHYYLGIELMYRGQLQDARVSFLKAYGGIPSGVVIFRTALLKSMISCLMELKEYHEAREVAVQGLREYPDFPDLWFFLGIIDFEDGKIAEACRHFHRALEIGEGNPLYSSSAGVGGYQALYWLGYCYQRLSRPDEALFWYSKSVRENPLFSLPLYGLLDLLLQRGGPGEVEAYLAREKLKAPLLPEVLTYLYGFAGYYREAMAYLQNNESAGGCSGLARILLERARQAKSSAPKLPGLTGPLGR